MNEVAAIAPVITAGNAALRREFPLKLFAIRRVLRRIALGKRANYYLREA